MASIFIPEKEEHISTPSEVSSFLNQKGIPFERWSLQKKASNIGSEVLAIYKNEIAKLKSSRGYITEDVIAVDSQTEGIAGLREKFLTEHTHAEDEVRFFVKGHGLFWFHLKDHPVFCVECEAGDLMIVPAKTPHWFDFGKIPLVQCIRLFNTKEGWVADYTHSGIEKKYPPKWK